MYSVLNIFPILFLAPLGYLVLRVMCGIVLIALARTRAWHEGSSLLYKGWGVGVSGVGILLILGLFTQIAAILAVLLALIAQKAAGTQTPIPYSTRLLIIGCALTLLVTGAGAFAIDLPV